TPEKLRGVRDPARGWRRVTAKMPRIHGAVLLEQWGGSDRAARATRRVGGRDGCPQHAGERSGRDGGAHHPVPIKPRADSRPYVFAQFHARAAAPATQVAGARIDIPVDDAVKKATESARILQTAIRPTRAEIDLSAVQHNLRLLRAHLAAAGGVVPRV